MPRRVVLATHMSPLAAFRNGFSVQSKRQAVMGLIDVMLTTRTSNLLIHALCEVVKGPRGQSRFKLYIM